MVETATLTLAYILDLLIGDPKWLPHPVRGIGWLIGQMERVLRGENRTKVIPAKAGIQVGAYCNTPLQVPVKPEDDKKIIANLKEKSSGVILVAVVVGATYCLFYFINSLLSQSQLSLPISYFSFIILAVLSATTLATHDLVRSGRKVIAAVTEGRIEEARKKLSMIVGRDTNALDEKGILRATIETLAENASDGIVAPLFYFAIGGLPLAMAYKAVNTLDSMVGYKNERYKHFGWAAARLDDIANFIPARITGVLIAVSEFILHLSLVTCHLSLKIMLRDGRKHSSPNSGVPEAAMAGALGIRLGGPSTYGGVLVEKPYIGEEGSGFRVQGSSRTDGQIYLAASENAVAIVKLTSFLGLGLALILLYLRSIICCG